MAGPSASISLLRQATVHRQAGRLVEAIVAMEQASRLAPGNAHIHHDIGLSYLTLGQPDRALVALDRAVAADRTFGHAHFRRGVALEQLGREVEVAEAAYRQAVIHAPEIAEAHARLAALRHVMGRRLDAIVIYREAARRAVDPTQKGIYLARAALLEPDLDTAERHLWGVLTFNAGAVKALGLLAYIKNARGDFREAERLIERALRQQPGEVGLYFELVQTRRITATDGALIARMQAAVAGRQHPATRARLHRALAKALDDTGDHAGAGAQLMLAGDLHAAHFPIDRAALVSLVDTVIGLFTPELLRRPAHAASSSAPRRASELPILVLGMPRSGTTLTEQILSSHSRVAAGGEIHFWEARGRAFLRQHAAGTTDIEALAEAYVARLDALAAGASRVTDKNPFNFMWAGLAHLVFPEARIVHCRRHPADCALSIMFADLAPQPLFSHARDDLAFYYAQYMRVMAHWRAVLPVDRFFELHYEELVRDPEVRTRELLAFCGMAWEAACATPERNTRVVMTASVWQVRQPIFTTSAGRRRHYEALLAPFSRFDEDAAGH